MAICRCNGTWDWVIQCILQIDAFKMHYIISRTTDAQAQYTAIYQDGFTCNGKKEYWVTQCIFSSVGQQECHSNILQYGAMQCNTMHSLSCVQQKQYSMMQYSVGCFFVSQILNQLKFRVAICQEARKYWSFSKTVLKVVREKFSWRKDLRCRHGPWEPERVGSISRVYHAANF